MRSRTAHIYLLPGLVLTDTVLYEDVQRVVKLIRAVLLGHVGMALSKLAVKLLHGGFFESYIQDQTFNDKVHYLVLVARLIGYKDTCLVLLEILQAGQELFVEFFAS